MLRFRFYFCVFSILWAVALAEEETYAQIETNFKEEIALRENLSEHLNARADAFRRSASRCGWNSQETADFIKRGTRNLYSASPSVVRENRKAETRKNEETQFLLQALESLGETDGVSRAKDFVQKESVFRRQVSVRESFERAALGKSADGVTCDVRSFLVLHRWKDSTCTILAMSEKLAQEAPFKPAVPYKKPQLLAVSVGSVLQDFRTVLALAAETPFFADASRSVQNERAAQPDFYHLTASLSAGRALVLLI